MLVDAYPSQQEARRAEHAGNQACAELARAVSELDSSNGTSVSIGNGMVALWDVSQPVRGVSCVQWDDGRRPCISSGARTSWRSPRRATAGR